MTKKTQMFLALLIGLFAGLFYRCHLDQQIVYQAPERMFVDRWILVQEPCPKEEKEVKEKPIQEKIKETFPECPDIALAIAIAESKLNPNAVNTGNKNGSVDRGIFQINSIHGHGEELFNADTNLQIARKIYDKNGWKAWSAYKNGAYLRHLK